MQLPDWLCYMVSGSLITIYAVLIFSYIKNYREHCKYLKEVYKELDEIHGDIKTADDTVEYDNLIATKVNVSARNTSNVRN